MYSGNSRNPHISITNNERYSEPDGNVSKSHSALPANKLNVEAKKNSEIAIMYTNSTKHLRDLQKEVVQTRIQITKLDNQIQRDIKKSLIGKFP